MAIMKVNLELDKKVEHIFFAQMKRQIKQKPMGILKKFKNLKDLFQQFLK
jgi:hypothetical protein